MSKKAITYRDDKGRLLPSATTILQCLSKPALIPWAAGKSVDFVEEHRDMLATDGQLILKLARRAHEDARRQGAVVGSEVHAILETGLRDPYSTNEVVGAVRRATKRWEWLEQEIVVINRDLGYGGTVDALARLPSGEHVLVDFKTSARVYPEQYLQLAMYMIALPKQYELHDVWTTLSCGRIVLINPNLPQVQVVDVDCRVHARVVPSLMNVYAWWKEMQRWT